MTEQSAKPSAQSSDSDNNQLVRSDGSAVVFHARYEVKEVLGKGLASTVRRCVEKSTAKVFAVKVVDVTRTGEPESTNEAARRLTETLGEVNILRKLAEHPSIIHLYGFYHTSCFLFVVFQMAQGELLDMLNKSVTFSEKRARPVMQQLCDAVAFMHTRNIVHRDLKLENVLYIDARKVIISDFGFAVELQPDEKLRELLGTPGYLAPETIRCKMNDQAEGYGVEVDDWALGVVLYVLLAGYAPFFNRRQLQMLRMIQQGKYNFDGDRWKEISEDAKDLIRNLLVVNVTKRFTAAKCLEHPWMKADAVSPLPVSPRGGASPTGGQNPPDGQRSPPGDSHSSQDSASTETSTSSATQTSLATDKEKKSWWRCWRLAIIGVRFLVRLLNAKRYELTTAAYFQDLKCNPFKDRNVRQETETSVFGVYKHWLGRSADLSRNELFANKPRPKPREGR